MNTELVSFILIMLVVAALMLLGELLHRIFRASKSLPARAEPTAEASEQDLYAQADRYSIRHLERFFLVLFALFVSYLLLLARRQACEVPILIVGLVGVWWAFRRGVLR